MLHLLCSTAKLFGYHVIISIADLISARPAPSKHRYVRELLRENLALKAQLHALRLEIKQLKGPRPRLSVRSRAAQVFAYLITRKNTPFHHFNLSASPRTISRWLARFRLGPFRSPQPNLGGRPLIDRRVRDLIVLFNDENPLWGARRIKQQLRQLGIRVSEPTIQKVLREAGFPPRPGHPLSVERWRSPAKDAMWAVDFFIVRTVRGRLHAVLLIIDLHTRQLLDLRVAPTSHPSSAWTVRAVDEALRREARRPQVIIHDHGSHFAGQFSSQLRVLGIEQRRTPVSMPFVNGIAERAVKSVRAELLNHVTARTAQELQWLVDEYREFYNTCRPHQALDGHPPNAFAEDQPLAPVIDLASLRPESVKRMSFAHGILNGYVLVDTEPIAA